MLRPKDEKKINLSFMGTKKINGYQSTYCTNASEVIAFNRLLRICSLYTVDGLCLFIGFIETDMIELQFCRLRTFLNVNKSLK